MDYYLDIEVLPFDEFSEGSLLSTAFGRVHHALARLGSGRMGISFPRHGITLGNILRLHGTFEELEMLRNAPELRGLLDYVRVIPTSKVPSNVSYRRVRRRQVKSSADRLRRRSIKNGRLNETEAMRKISEDKEQRLSLPFVTIKSSSTGEVFKLFIDHGEELEEPAKGMFSAYGLSLTATIPWF